MYTYRATINDTDDKHAYHRNIINGKWRDFELVSTFTFNLSGFNCVNLNVSRLCPWDNVQWHKSHAKFCKNATFAPKA
jgi:hypothetical protein